MIYHPNEHENSPKHWRAVLPKLQGRRGGGKYDGPNADHFKPLGFLDTVVGFSAVIALPVLAVIAAAAIGVQSGGGTIFISSMLAAVTGWYVVREQRHFGGLTLVSCFAVFFVFIYVARALYIGYYDDFYLIDSMEVPDSGPAAVTTAMVFVVLGSFAFMIGSMTLLPRAASAWRGRIGVFERSYVADGIDMSWLFIIVQAGIFLVMLPMGIGERGAIYGLSDSAYIYMLPTLVHGFDLYFFVYTCARLRRRRSPLTLQSLALCVAFLLLHAFLISNMSIFRGVYLVGLFCCAVAALVIFFGRVSAWFAVALIAIYPFFKMLGNDRDMNNQEILQAKILQPWTAYSKESLDDAFGRSTDLNMLDTFVASLNGEHSFRGYILSYAYVFVHWVPRSLWPSKPAQGILSDISYTRGKPFSPGIIGFFHDDGGRIYMIIMMFVLGWFMRWCEIRSNMSRSYEMQVVTFSALFLSALVTTRYFPYQIFYGFLTFYVPAFICDYAIQRRNVRERQVAKEFRPN